MTNSRLEVLPQDEHLRIDHVMLFGTAEDLRKGDIILDTQYWVQRISEGKHNNAPAVTIQLAPIDAPGHDAGRLTLRNEFPVVFARPLGYEQWDPSTTDTLMGFNYDEAIAMQTSDLKPGDWIGYEEFGDHEKIARPRRVKAVYPNGLIEFHDGAYQSEPTLSWWVLSGIDENAVALTAQ